MNEDAKENLTRVLSDAKHMEQVLGATAEAVRHAINDVLRESKDEARSYLACYTGVSIPLRGMSDLVREKIAEHLREGADREAAMRDHDAFVDMMAKHVWGKLK